MIHIDENDSRVSAFRREEKLLKELEEKRAQTIREIGNQVESGTKAILDREVDALLTAANGGSEEPRSDDLENLQHRKTILDRAIEKQKKVMERARSDFSAAICESKAVRKQYVEIERRIAKAIRELAEANEAESHFFEKLRDIGVSSIPFSPMRMTSVGTFSDTQSAANFRLREIEKACSITT